MRRISLILAAALLTVPVAAQNVDQRPAPEYASLKRMLVPVIAGDVTDRPYRVIEELEVKLNKATRFSRDPSEAKVFAELWERARKLGADAVVNASYGSAQEGGLMFGFTRAKGQAIKFLSDEEAAQWRAQHD